VDRAIAKVTGPKAAVQINSNVVSGFNSQTGRTELADKRNAPIYA
jgi:hypothetical protein